MNNQLPFPSTAAGDIAKLAEAATKLKTTGLLTQENAEKINKIIGIVLDKVEAGANLLDFTKPKAPEVVAPVVIAPPVIQYQPPAPPQEQLYGGRTFAELKNLNTWTLLPIAQKLSAYPNANPNVPMQQQKLEEDWRQELIAYITSNNQWGAGRQ